jgi:hypothetical protein
VRWPQRVYIARNIYVLVHLDALADKSFLLAVFSAFAAYAVPESIGLAPDESLNLDEQTAVLLLYMLSSAAAVPLIAALRGGSRALQPLSRAVMLIHTTQHPSARKSTLSHYARLRDPWALERNDLMTTAKALDRVAARISVKSPCHPVATILLACSDHIRQHLAGLDSLGRVLTCEIRTLLCDVLIVLAGPSQVSTLRAVAKSVEAFDGDGRPRSVSPRASASRWAALFDSVAAYLDGYSSLLKSLWTIFIIIAAVALIITGRVQLGGLQLQL